jgi:hypothetical protein
MQPVDAIVSAPAAKAGTIKEQLFRSHLPSPHVRDEVGVATSGRIRCHTKN